MQKINHFPFSFSFSLSLMFFLMVILLSACGSRGDLYQVDDSEIEQNSVDKAHQKNRNDTKKKPK